MSDHEEIRRTLAEYCQYVDDETRLEEIADLWSADAILSSNGSMLGSGRAGVTEWFANRFRGPETVWRGKHLTLNAIIDVDVDGGSAQAHSDWLYLLPTDTGPTIVGTGTYVDELVRDADRWRFRSRDIGVAPRWLPVAVRS